MGVYLNAGREHAVASTKAFTTQVGEGRGVGLMPEPGDSWHATQRRDAQGYWLIDNMCIICNMLRHNDGDDPCRRSLHNHCAIDTD